MFDLGDYAFNILTSYAATILLLGGLIFQSVRRQRKIRASIRKFSEK